MNYGSILIFIPFTLMAQTPGDEIWNAWQYKADLPSVATFPLPGANGLSWMIQSDAKIGWTWPEFTSGIQLSRERYGVGMQWYRSGSGEWSSNALRTAFALPIQQNTHVGVRFTWSWSHGNISTWNKLNGDLYSHFSFLKWHFTLCLQGLLSYTSHTDWNSQYHALMLQADYYLTDSHHLHIRLSQRMNSESVFHLFYGFSHPQFEGNIGISSIGALFINGTFKTKNLHISCGASWTPSSVPSSCLTIGNVSS